jgi:hypothetical protein
VYKLIPDVTFNFIYSKLKKTSAKLTGVSHPGVSHPGW